MSNGSHSWEDCSVSHELSAPKNKVTSRYKRDWLCDFFLLKLPILIRLGLKAIFIRLSRWRLQSETWSLSRMENMLRCRLFYLTPVLMELSRREIQSCNLSEASHELLSALFTPSFSRLQSKKKYFIAPQSFYVSFLVFRPFEVDLTLTKF